MRKLLLLLVLLVSAAIFIWPTRYREFAVGEGPYAEQAGPLRSRVDRLSGAVQAFSTSGEWKALTGARPELLRPDITGPAVETRVDTSPAQEQGRSIERMQEQTNAMEAAARTGAVK